MARTTMICEKYLEGKISKSTSADLMRPTEAQIVNNHNCTPVWDIILFYFIEYQP